MKKLITIITLAFLVSSCGASKEFDYRNSYTDEVLDGIFKLRLGMSKAELREAVDTTLLHYGGYGIIYDIYTELYKEFIREEKYNLKKYFPAFGYTIEDIDLKFFDDKLYQIRIWGYNSNLERLLTEKYGEPKSKIEKDFDIEYKPLVERMSEDDTIKEITERNNFYKTWRTNNKDITCTSKKTKYYVLELENTAVLSELSKINHDAHIDPRELKSEKKSEKQLLEEL